MVLFFSCGPWGIYGTPVFHLVPVFFIALNITEIMYLFLVSGGREPVSLCPLLYIQ